jgi:beta-1,4-mannosyl-glycoprotein beta-1,4-N-acetylglucosaminyltransferase
MNTPLTRFNRYYLLRAGLLIALIWVCFSSFYFLNKNKQRDNSDLDTSSPSFVQSRNEERHVGITVPSPQKQAPVVQQEKQQEEQQQPVQIHTPLHLQPSVDVKLPKFNTEKFDGTDLLPCLVSQMKSLGLMTETLDKPVRIFDGFTFNDEFDILEIRMNELYQVVDYFIVVEAPWTLQNTPKPLYFQQNKERFKKFEKQIIHVIVNTRLPDFKYWENESYYRSAIGAIALKSLIGGSIDSSDQVHTVDKVNPPTDTDLVQVFDVDEFPDPDALYILKWHKLPAHASMIQFAYRWTYYGFQWDNGKTWNKCGLFPLKTLKLIDPQGLLTNQVRFNCLKQNPIIVGSQDCPAGWHCSWCLHPRSYKVKIDSFAHKEYRDQLKIWKRDYTDEKLMWDFVKSGVFLGSMNDKGEFISVDRMVQNMPHRRLIPRYALANIQSYPYLVYPDPLVTDTVQRELASKQAIVK